MRRDILAVLLERAGGGAEVVEEGDDGCGAGDCFEGESTGRAQKGGSPFESFLHQRPPADSL